MNPTVGRTATVALLLATLAVSASSPPAASAAKPCGKRALFPQQIKPRIAVVHTTCEQGFEVISDLYDLIETGAQPDRHYRWHVGAYRCFTGLASSEAWCHHRASGVFSSTRPEHHPAQWPIPTERRGPYWRKCGSQNHPGAGWYHVKAHNVHCGKARSVARHVFHSFDPDPSPFGFSCTTHQVGYELSRAACRRLVGSRVQKVRFVFGA